MQLVNKFTKIVHGIPLNADGSNVRHKELTFKYAITKCSLPTVVLAPFNRFTLFPYYRFRREYQFLHLWNVECNLT